jgi:hypothetical protein
MSSTPCVPSESSSARFPPPPFTIGPHRALTGAKRDTKVADVLAELDTSHRDLVTAAVALGHEHFAAGASSREIFEGTGALHYREHAGQIRRWRQSRSD